MGTLCGTGYQARPSARLQHGTGPYIQVDGKWGPTLVRQERHQTYQRLFYEQTEQDGIAHLPKALKHICLELRILNDVLQLVVEELQDPCEWEQEVSTEPGCSMAAS